MSRRIGYHQCRKIVFILNCFLTKVCSVDVSVIVAFNNHHLHARHSGTCRICTMGRGRDKTNIPVPFATAYMILPDHQQSRVFSRGARIGHERNGIKSCDLAKILLQLTDQVLITFGLVFGYKRMNSSKLGITQCK